jgi:hypothetical protein
MADTVDGLPCNTCSEMLAFAYTEAGLSDAQRRFLDAYKQYAVVAPAARLARVHRVTVWRWRRDPAFVAAMRAAAEVFFDEHRAKVLAQEAERQRWREERERSPQRQAMRRENLARARARRWRRRSSSGP